MSHNISEKPGIESEIEAHHPKHDSNYDVEEEKLDYNRAGAIDAENIEHNMGVIDAVKAYPAASFWAFVMSATIVSSCPQSPR
jgi:SP family general alpha glucoside:H+ symporter-like MFS transporter